MTKWQKVGRNAPCPCGSGLKYKKCHMASDQEDGKTPLQRQILPANTRKQLDEATLAFISLLRDIFGIKFDASSGRGIVSGPVTPDRVKRVHELLPTYFPHKSSLEGICQDISKGVFAGLYWGEPDINGIAAYMARYALYTEKILICNPFCDLMLYHMDESPLKTPEQWTQVTMNQALLLVSLEPWIQEGVVCLIPPLKWYDYDLYKNRITALTQERLRRYDDAANRKLDFETLMQQIRHLRPELVEPYLQQIMGTSGPLGLAKAMQTLAEGEFIRNPIRYAWDDPNLAQPHMMKTGPGNSLESTMFIADLCGSYVIFGEELYRFQYDLAVGAANASVGDAPLTDMSRAFAGLTFGFLNDVRLDFVLGLRKDGRLARLRTFLLDLWSEASSVDLKRRTNAYTSFADRLREEYENYKREWEGIEGQLLRKILVCAGGGGLAWLSGAIDFKLAAAGYAAFGIEQLIETRIKRNEHSRLPLGVFLQLEKGR